MEPRLRDGDMLAARFRTFADVECSGESGLNVESPTYEALSRGIANDAELLGLARECRIGQPLPNLFFAAVKRALADDTRAELARHYERAASGEPPSPTIGSAFADFCADNRGRIARLARSRLVQTNEIRRCAYLMPAFGVVALDAPRRPLALIDVGASAGLNLLWDRYRYRYSDGSRYGPSGSAVVVESETRTPMPPLPARFPRVAFRVGIDLSPVNLRDDEEYAWMRALVWPDHPDRAALLDAARDIWLEDPPEIRAGDALDLLPAALADAPPDAALCVFHCHTLNQLPPSARGELYALLESESHRRTVYHIPSEGERMETLRIERGRSTTLLSAIRSAHGRWIEWETTP